MTTTWEENAERRLNVLEKKMDDLLDPKTGVYPMLRHGQSRLEGWAIAILTLLVGNAAVIIIFLR